MSAFKTEFDRVKLHRRTWYAMSKNTNMFFSFITLV
jgi:hypothetical protein